MKNCYINYKKERGITITVPAEATCGLYKNIPDSIHYFKTIDIKNAITPNSVTRVNGECVYYYDDLTVGLYHYGVSMDGYTSVCQIINYTEKKAVDGIYINVKLQKLCGDGYEKGFVMLNTEEFINAHLKSEKNTWGEEYTRLFNTPQFTRSKDRSGKHQQTTNEELYNYIDNILKTSNNMYVFYLGKTPKYNFDMPMVLFTRENISGMTLEQAAEIIRNNGKPTVQYTAQIHSTEPSSSEGALAMIGDLAGEYGNQVLDYLDVYIIPRINLDGAVEYIRESPSTNEDMNRDYLRMNNREVFMVNSVYNMFLPEIVIDGHEKRTEFLKTGESLCTDLEVQANAGALNHPAKMTELAMDIALTALKKARSIGLRAHFFEQLASAAGGAAGSSYYGTRNSLSFLVETPGGLSCGMLFIERRLIAQYIMASSVINYAVQHADEVMETVHQSRQKMVKMGNTYDETNLIVLNHGKKQTQSFITPLINVINGNIIDPNHTVPYNEHIVAIRSRSRPTAYILPKGLENEQEILRVLLGHAIPYYNVPALSIIKARQYIKNDTEIVLSEDIPFCFENGAYIFVNTVPSTILSVIMEPDFNTESGRKMSLLSMGLVTADELGRLPIYRYCHNLTNGKISLD